MAGAYSNGLLADDSPLKHSVPLLLLQLLIIIGLSRFLALFLRHLRQPRVIAEVIGGVILGPSVMGYIPGYLKHLFPSSSIPILESTASIGLLFFLFLVGLELDIGSLKAVGPKAFAICASGIAVPFALSVPITVAIKQLDMSTVGFGYLYLFVGVALGITAFPVLARILAETRLLTTDIGRIVMAAAAVEDVVAWCLLALTVAVLNARNATPLVGLWIFLAGIGFIIFMFTCVKPVVHYIARRNDERGIVSEFSVFIALCLVLAASFITDMIGIHPIFGAFIAGLMIPHDSAYAITLTTKVEDFISVIFLPAYFAVSGLRTQVSSIDSGKAILVLFVVILAACLGKIVGCTTAAFAFREPFRKALTIGLLMNSKGLVELIVLNVGLQAGVLNQQLFSIFVIMALVTTFMTTPLVMWVYPPARFQKASHPPAPKLQSLEGKQLRLLTCLFGRNDIPGAVNLSELAKGLEPQGLKVHALHLQELSERSSAILTMQRWAGRVSPAFGMTNIGVAFKSFNDLEARVPVTSSVAVSSIAHMHEDIKAAAERTQSNVLVLPYQRAGALGKLLDFPGSGLNQVKKRTRDNVLVLPYQRARALGKLLDFPGSGLSQITMQTLKHAPCSVALLVTPEESSGHSLQSPRSVSPERDPLTRAVMLFFGGADDREALSFATRIGTHAKVSLTVVRFRLNKAPAARASFSEGSALISRRQSAEIEAPVEATQQSEDVSIEVARLEPNREEDLDEAAAALLIAEIKKDRSEGRRERATLEEMDVDERNVQATVQALKLPEYDLVIVGRHVSRPLSCFPGEVPAPLSRGPSFKGLRDTLTATMSGREISDTKLVLGPVADAVLRIGVGEQASLLVVQEAQDKK
ncbi:cation/H+ antiporter family [Klebsormidium nitens]|uniref:Cation/H+ antiporter family n=1 Tax=Klebsormidium nitens TaxID=105231 RepID=A0A1Y1HWM4_KLENI|nr:cation/H+ antiporter family [Klebsormidium nitens]|eukprot:GAQ80927.1 cation/H+ antiporter family [Klebsormidium nitens]